MSEKATYKQQPRMQVHTGFLASPLYVCRLWKQVEVWKQVEEGVEELDQHADTIGSMNRSTRARM